mmetsp:Transcript_544/g.901  ORF Transcript_544/g.901 Transcript_544/m.901 type:complete len:226 (+) Transcript_544:1726-2403(+)
MVVVRSSSAWIVCCFPHIGRSRRRLLGIIVRDTHWRADGPTYGIVFLLLFRLTSALGKSLGQYIPTARAAFINIGTTFRGLLKHFTVFHFGHRLQNFVDVAVSCSRLVDPDAVFDIGNFRVISTHDASAQHAPLVLFKDFFSQKLPFAQQLVCQLAGTTSQYLLRVRPFLDETGLLLWNRPRLGSIFLRNVVADGRRLDSNFLRNVAGGKSLYKRWHLGNWFRLP